MSRLSPLPLVLLLAGCSPIYVVQSAAGHADLLLRRRSIKAALADPRTPAEVRGPLRTAVDAKRFAVETMGLAKNGDYETWVELDRPAVTWLVSASSRVKLEAYEWSFPPVGRYPYKGFFKRERALRERDRMEAKGYDAVVRGAAAYNTPLPVSDPLPSPVLKWSTGSLAALMIHETCHGSIKFKDRMAFNESACEFVGERGAMDFLKDQPEAAAAYKKELAEGEAAAAIYEKLGRDLEALYGQAIPDLEKIERRRPLFDAAKAELENLGYRVDRLNNASVTAHRVYHDELPFAGLLEKEGGDWKRFLSAVKNLDPKDPAADLRRKSK